MMQLRLLTGSSQQFRIAGIQHFFFFSFSLFYPGLTVIVFLHFILVGGSDLGSMDSIFTIGH